MSSKVIGIVNQKGGVGKTTTAVNLAACLTEHRKKILLIDLDPQANATSGLGIRKEPGISLYAALQHQAPALEYIRETETPGLHIIPSEIDLAGAEIELSRSGNYLGRLRGIIHENNLLNEYDYILLDCSPSLGLLTMNVLAASDELIIPIQCEYYALEGLSVMQHLIRRLKDSGANPDLEIEGIVMTMYDMRTNLSQQVVQEVITHYGAKVYETLIPRNVRLGEAPSYGLPIMKYDPYCTGAVAYKRLAKEFLERHTPLDSPAPLHKLTFPNLHLAEIPARPEPVAIEPPTTSEIQP
ncbi:MAG: ParA family protein [Kiritimatiellae bacterium]|nr:ParA family protein [Kiritimatiellia bacterium]